MAGKFELFKDKAGKFRFRLQASNGQIIAVGEAYETKAAAKGGIESVKKNAADAPSSTRRPSSSGSLHLSLRRLHTCCVRGSDRHEVVSIWMCAGRDRLACAE